jgi:phenylacetate-CoA ligase
VRRSDLAPRCRAPDLLQFNGERGPSMGGNTPGTTQLSQQEAGRLAERLIPDGALRPASVDAVAALPSFRSVLRACESACDAPYGSLPGHVQDALVLRRLGQMFHTVMLNGAWADRMRSAGVTSAPATFEEWQRIPLSDKQVQADFFMGTRPGLVVPLDRGGFEIVASGGTSGGVPVESVYSVRELHDTYRVAGEFMGTHMLPRYLTGEGPKWLSTTLADYQMWSSGTMVGGVLQNVPGVNYIGAGPVTAPVLAHMFSYPGPKALMGITAGIAILADLGADMPRAARESFRVAMYGSGVLSQRKREQLAAVYPNLAVLSYFAATQAETIGLQLNHRSPVLSAVPGLHLIEIVDENGRWVNEGEEGELVVTRLHAHEAPFLRFKLGDRMIRHPRSDAGNLRTEQFEFSGRTGEVLHLNDTQYSAVRAYEAVCDGLSGWGLPDLRPIAHDVQFVNNREARMITLTAAVDAPAVMTSMVEGALGACGVRAVFVDSLPKSLSLFNHGEANSAAIEKTGYEFALRFVDVASLEIERTTVGKVPLVRDHG